MLRFVFPILKLGKIVVVTRYDDVKEILGDGFTYRAPYVENLKTVTGGNHEFILGMDPGTAYDHQRRVLINQIHSIDLSQTIPSTASEVVSTLISNKKQIEVVEVIRRATSIVLLGYFGLSDGSSDCELAEYEKLALDIFKY